MRSPWKAKRARLDCQGAPIVSAYEVAGDLWLQVHRFDDARRAYVTAAEQVGSTRRVTLGLARTAVASRRSAGGMRSVPQLGERMAKDGRRAARADRGAHVSPSLRMPHRVGVATVTTYRYRADVLEQLERHGVRPTSSTRPELVHEFVSDLYRYELRRLRGRLVRGEIPKDGLFRSGCRAQASVSARVAEAARLVGG